METIFISTIYICAVVAVVAVVYSICVTRILQKTKEVLAEVEDDWFNELTKNATKRLASGFKTYDIVKTSDKLPKYDRRVLGYITELNRWEECYFTYGKFLICEREANVSYWMDFPSRNLDGSDNVESSEYRNDESDKEDKK